MSDLRAFYEITFRPSVVGFGAFDDCVGPRRWHLIPSLQVLRRQLVVVKKMNDGVQSPALALKFVESRQLVVAVFRQPSVEVSDVEIFVQIVELSAVEIVLEICAVVLGSFEIAGHRHSEPEAAEPRIVDERHHEMTVCVCS